MDFFSVVPAHVYANPTFVSFVKEAVSCNVFAQSEPWELLEPMLDRYHDAMEVEDIELLDWMCEFCNYTGFEPVPMGLASRLFALDMLEYATVNGNVVYLHTHKKCDAAYSYQDPGLSIAAAC
jgi:hypothetical protein